MDIEKKITKLSTIIYKRHCQRCKRAGKSSYSNDIENKLIGLHPGTDKNLLVEQYYTAKITKAVIIAVASLLLIIAISISSLTDTRLTDGYQVHRNDYGGGDYNLNLMAQTDTGKYDIEVVVNEKHYTPEEISRIMDDVAERMKAYIRGDNESLDQVNCDLDLPSEINSYPIDIRWETDNYELIRTDGTVGDGEIDQNGSIVNLKMILSYYEYKQEYIYRITLYPRKMSREDQYKNEIITSIQEAQKESENNDYFVLPMSGSSGNISWNEAKEPVAIIMAILSGIALVAVWVGVDNDLAKEYRKRNQSLHLEYSEFVSKLQLLISSGMTLRSAFERMGDDYKQSIINGGDKKYVYEELLISIKQMRDGISENKCYEQFGNRCTLLCYRKLASLLTQNLKKGTSGMVAALSNETKQAFEERKMAARKQGEEAQTKLLFPMIIMLGVVMIIIMIPAYMSFGA